MLLALLGYKQERNHHPRKTFLAREKACSRTRGPMEKWHQQRAQGSMQYDKTLKGQHSEHQTPALEEEKNVTQQNYIYKEMKRKINMHMRIMSNSFFLFSFYIYFYWGMWYTHISWRTDEQYGKQHQQQGKFAICGISFHYIFFVFLYPLHNP